MSITIDGSTAAAKGFSVRKLDRWLDGPALQRGMTAVPQVLGVVPSASATIATRSRLVTFNVPCATLADRLTKMATLRDWLSDKLLHTRFDDTPGLKTRCVAGEFEVESIVPRIAMSVLGAPLIVTVPLISYDASMYDAEPQTIVLSTTPAQIALGTLPSTGVVQWSGSWSAGVARTLTYRSHNGISYGTLVFTPPAGASLTSAEYLEIDLSRQYVTKVSSTGVRSNAFDWLSGGAWFAPDPADSVRSLTRWPTLDISAGVAIYLYRKVWAL